MISTDWELCNHLSSVPLYACKMMQQSTNLNVYRQIMPTTYLGQVYMFCSNKKKKWKKNRKKYICFVLKKWLCEGWNFDSGATQTLFHQIKYCNPVCVSSKLLGWKNFKIFKSVDNEGGCGVLHVWQVKNYQSLMFFHGFALWCIILCWHQVMILCKNKDAF